MEQQYVISTLQFPETLDNKYEINITVTNIAGRKYQTTYYVYRDTDAPVLESVIIPKVAAEAGQVFYEKGEKYGYYTNKEVKAIVTMDDGGNGSGVNNITLFFFKIQKCRRRFHFKRCRVRSHFVRNFTDTAYIISISVLNHIFCIYTKLFKIIKNRR